MKVKRFVAQDMRQAIRMVRDSLGEDAVILSNKGVDGGVELMAAVDLEPSMITEGEVRSAQHSAGEDRRINAAPAPVSRLVADRPSATDTLPTPESLADNPIAKMQLELQSMRQFMESELSQLSWRDRGERQPVSRENLRQLIALGIAPDLARQLSEQVGELENPDMAWRKSLYYLASRIERYETELIDQGGTVALIGPTGVGKTTSIAKIAAKFALRHGQRHVGLISIDNFRIGARDQLHTYGRILNVPVRTAANVAELDQAIDELSDRQLVLIDTAGMGSRNDRFEEQMHLLSESSHDITRILTLSTTTQEQALTRAVELFSGMQPQACLLTKLDEAASLGNVISTIIRHKLPVAFLADGQRVPEDLHLARAHPLVNRAVELADQQPFEPDPDFMAYACTGARVHAQL